MSGRKSLLNLLSSTLSSSKLALVLVIILILFSIAGAVLPQQGKVSAGDITAWQQTHPGLTAVLQPVGAFDVFHSWPFMATIVLLAVNTLTCTVLRFLKQGGLSSLTGPAAIENTGSLLLHLGLLILFGGAFLTAAMGMRGHTLLTEGQRFSEQHNSYLRLVEGPLRREHHQGFTVALKDVRTKYESGRYEVDITSNLEFFAEDGKTETGRIKVNKPFTSKGLTFTLDKTGFSLRLMIRDNNTQRGLFNSFVALQTFRNGNDLKYHDFLPLPFFKNKVYVTLYPAHERSADGVVKIGEEPDSPLVIIEMEDDLQQIAERGDVSLGGTVTLGRYSFDFEELRRWSSFMIVADPGYPVVCVSLWLGLGALILRYFPDLRKWLREK
jgi:cytochrome c biogenesis protein ResB